ncbi:MAG: PKD domain-containing protein [Candidatus Bathyarchaeota archaeon]|nr:PKD domain-containing protein [Candidatus Bathyarchaeota archaeon]
MKTKGFLIVILLVIAAIVPLLAIQAQAILSAGPDQQVYTGETVTFNGTTTENVSSIIQVTWDFGDNSTPVNGSNPALLNTTHVYATDGVYNATLTVKFDSTLNKTESAVARITVLENQPPTVNAGANVTVEQESHAGTQVTLNGTAIDAVSTRFNFTWIENGVVLKTEANVTTTTLTYTFNLGMHVVTLNATDQAGNTGSANVTVTVIDTLPPVVDAGPDITVEQESHAGTQVMLNGTATDICSTRFNFTWSENGTVLATTTNATGTTLTYTFNLGTHVVTLNATDMAGNIGSDNVTVTVIDTTPPEINATATPSTLWPPNHKYVEVKINVTVYDICDPSPTITLVSVTSNEPDNGIGDGNTVSDIVVVDDFTFTFYLRAERSGTGSGRVYTITYKATDASGNYATASVTVEVPHNQ